MKMCLRLFARSLSLIHIKTMVPMAGKKQLNHLFCAIDKRNEFFEHDHNSAGW